MALPVCFATTGNDALQLCKMKNSNYCDMYIVGMLDGLDEQLVRLMIPITELTKQNMFDATLGKLAPLLLDAAICRPEGMTYAQARDIFINYLNTNPEERHKSGQSLFYDSLKKVFPCDKIKK